MKTEIETRLRDFAPLTELIPFSDVQPLILEAAKEIKKLRRQLENKSVTGNIFF